MKAAMSYMNRTALNTMFLIASDSFVPKLHESIRSIEVLEPASVNHEDVKCETSTHNSQDVTEQTSTLPSVSQDVKLIPDQIDVLMSLHNSPNKYLIVEDVQKNAERYINNTNNKFSSLDLHLQSRMLHTESNKFATYQEEVPVEITEKGKKKENTEIEYFCKLPLSQIESKTEETIYHLKPLFKCLVCHKILKASFNIENTKILMIDEVKNDYLVPYQQKGIMGLVHLECKPQNLSCNDENNRYRCGLLFEKQLKNVISMQHQLYMLIITLALILSPIFLSFLAFSLSNSGVSNRGISIISLYCILFIGLVINELFRYYKKINEFVKTTYLIVWKVQSNSFPIKNFQTK
ncbi:uncharacterized protein LOC116845599 [Odontomachus brunneus]|uniref:uncharacterized protein LOC116845599 n=1 Tax=Odontomachus brunneus TaxID=486640 RepID=UPI0013F1D89A|nr:uncharacterized protein LOC116845599 [Odontomachus brunneus]XP_032674369.1 uncharacterized protein LOC116845599 [Odontomachus brunneus]XP_032674370.1 uncharacterized protein LOC116845599 [Odontomachus brunneus]XP_032674371.1 uncharacterized protein LOC116845599 [Odontomachus brunneus]XP_032674372.1 uncharacterized protein LOC116845599 [Odontomachus brunneus]XP_032674373.1 uncharacterized protein LOC116845599 [Odontomachus brunneus]XP_032674374.1 uncharacterized protein LOC116845599 [Odonto